MGGGGPPQIDETHGHRFWHILCRPRGGHKIVYATHYYILVTLSWCKRSHLHVHIHTSSSKGCGPVASTPRPCLETWIPPTPPLGNYAWRVFRSCSYLPNLKLLYPPFSPSQSFPPPFDLKAPQLSPQASLVSPKCTCTLMFASPPNPTKVGSYAIDMDVWSKYDGPKGFLSAMATFNVLSKDVWL